MIEHNEKFEDNSLLPFIIHPPSYSARGQVQFCRNLIVKFFREGYSPSKQEFPKVRMKRQLLDHYLNVITSYYGIFTSEVLVAQTNSAKTYCILQ